ncbi:MAG: glycoside hydrolase family 31 protein [Elusimicrobiales bacterium]|jgi:alpha-glucosidase
MRKITRFLAAISLLQILTRADAAVNIDSFSEIGPVSGFTRSGAAVTFSCKDGSRMRVSILAPDLVRVRASFGKDLSERDHSWAIDKTAWETPRWDLKEDKESVTIVTDELEVVVRREPLLVEFRDAKTHEFINGDGRPMLFDAQGAAVAAAKKLGLDEHFYGLGEKAAKLDKRRGAFTNWNSDTPAYHEGTDPIYQTIPFYIGWRNGAAYGVFFDNSYRSYFDFGRSGQQYAVFAADGGEMNYYFFAGPSIKKILSRYTELTGRMPLPPLWALGHQQSRWGYYPDTMAEEIVRRYRKDDLPLDALHLDINYMDGYRVFTWDGRFFPDPAGLTGRLKQQGVKTVVIVDPGVKYQPAAAPAKKSASPELGPHDKNYYVYEEGLKNDYFLKRGNGELYIGKVWPGESVFVDYTVPAAAGWWGGLHKAYLAHGVDGIWNDMNEPADFFDQTGRTQADVVSNDQGEMSLHAKNRNVFALLMARASYQGLEKLAPDRRPYLITRAGYAGIQRYSTMWTGDAPSTWDALALSVPMLQTLGLSGESFVGSDTGGFMGDSNGELLTRWYQVSFLTPFCRNHHDISGYDQEPWRFGGYYEDIIRKYLKLRYRLMPFLYNRLEEAHRTGVPPFRPLLLNYQEDQNTLTLDDQFMIGEDLLAAPILAAGRTSRAVYLPDGLWYDYWTGKQYNGGRTITVDAPLETVPLFVRGGAVIPMWPEMNYIGEKPADPVTFAIRPDKNGSASTVLYEDDGGSPDYKNGMFRRTAVNAYRSGNTMRIELLKPEGPYLPASRSFVFTASAQGVREVLKDGKPLNRGTGKEGWNISGGVLSLKIIDDGKAHSMSVR